MAKKELSWFYMFIDCKTAIQMMSPELCKSTIIRLFEYLETSEIPQGMNDTESFAFLSMKRCVDVAVKHYEDNVEKNRRAAMKRWYGNSQNQKPQEPALKEEPVEQKEEPKEADKPKKVKPKFAKPTVEEVRVYCTERRNAVDPESFVDFYESKGWMVGPNPMKDWKAAVRTWEKRNTGRRDEDLTNDTTRYNDDDLFQ